jgi:hypothetical protein
MRWRVSRGTLTAMTPHEFTISAARVERRNSRSPAVRNACDAFICSVFRYLADQLTVFPGAGIAEKFLPSEIPSKSFAWGESSKLRHRTNRYFSETCAFTR